MSVAGYFCLCVSNHLFIHLPIHPSLPPSPHPLLKAKPLPRTSPRKVTSHLAAPRALKPGFGASLCFPGG